MVIVMVMAEETSGICGTAGELVDATFVGTSWESLRNLSPCYDWAMASMYFMRCTMTGRRRKEQSLRARERDDGHGLDCR